jgi:ABC-type uncharacterized transport system permease subunit
MSDLMSTGFVIALFAAMFRMVTPILFASMGLMVVERGGILDLSIEGSMLMGALMGFAATYHTGSLWLGVLIAGLTGGAISLLNSFLIVALKMNQSVSGLSVNLLATGLSLYLFRVMFGREGYVVPTVTTFSPLSIPFLSKIPVLGEIFFSQYALTYLAFILAVVIWGFIYKTKYGLIIRCMGDNPHTVDTKGINVNLLHTLLLFFGGIMYGIGGAFLPLVSTGMYVQGITAGRGWIALVLVIFGNYKPFPILLGALLFGFLDALQLQIQSVGISFPYQILMALPYLLTLFVLIVGSKKSAKPLHLGIPYHRE